MDEFLDHQNCLEEEDVSDLQPKLAEMLSFLERSIGQNGYAPSIREIAAGTGISSFTTVKNRLDALEERGYIERVPNSARGLRIMGAPDQEAVPVGVGIPLLGQVSAGQPLLAQQNCETMLSLPPEMVGRGDFFALHVKGDSMIDAGINAGDVVVIRQQNTAENGDIVAALIGDEATIKRFFLEKDHVRLQPENAAYSPIRVIDPSILGKAVSLVKQVR